MLCFFSSFLSCIRFFVLFVEGIRVRIVRLVLNHSSCHRDRCDQPSVKPMDWKHTAATTTTNFHSIYFLHVLECHTTMKSHRIAQCTLSACTRVMNVLLRLPPFSRVRVCVSFACLFSASIVHLSLSISFSITVLYTIFVFLLCWNGLSTASSMHLLSSQNSAFRNRLPRILLLYDNYKMIIFLSFCFDLTLVLFSLFHLTHVWRVYVCSSSYASMIK